jgi:hypothetical protein
MRFLPLICVVVLIGCGGGPDVPPPGPAPHTLTWQPPAAFTDNTTLRPEADILEYDIYACDDILFLDNALPCATVAGVDNEARVVSFFDLWLLAPYGINPPKWISVKAVSNDNLASAFAAPVLWE